MTDPTRRSLLALVCLVSLGTWFVAAQTRPHYRGYRMGDDPSTVSRQLGVAPDPVAHEGGTSGDMVTELTWRAAYVRRGAEGPSDPVERLTFSFRSGRLFRVAIDYSPSRTEGMSEADIVEAVSHVYGQPTKRTDPPEQVGLEPMRPEDSVIAQWNNDEIRVALLRMHDRTVFRMIVASTPLEALVRAAGSQEARTNLDRWASADTGIREDRDMSDAERNQTRRANIASFIP